RNTIGNPNTDFYSRDPRKIINSRLNANLTNPVEIHVVTLGGTIDGFAGDLMEPPGTVSRVEEFIKSLDSDDHPIRYRSHRICFKDGRSLNGLDIAELSNYLTSIIKDSTDSKMRVMITGGTFALGNLARYIHSYPLPINLVGAWGPLNAES